MAETAGGMPRVQPDIRVRRVYDDPAPQDGARVLVDRVWPRGLRKDAARLDEWARRHAADRDPGHRPQPGGGRRPDPAARRMRPCSAGPRRPCREPATGRRGTRAGSGTGGGTRRRRRRGLLGPSRLPGVRSRDQRGSSPGLRIGTGSTQGSLSAPLVSGRPCSLSARTAESSKAAGGPGVSARA